MLSWLFPTARWFLDTDLLFKVPDKQINQDSHHHPRHDQDTCARSQWHYIGPGVCWMVTGRSASKLRGHTTVNIVSEMMDIYGDIFVTF